MSNKYGRQFYEEKWRVGGGYSIDPDLAGVIIDILLRCSHGGVHLDIGCGNGLFLSMLRNNASAQISMVGIDFSLEGLKHRVDPNLSLCIALATALPFKDEYFDTISCIEVIEHIWQLDMMLSETKRVCKTGGIVVFVVPNFMRLNNRLLMLRGIYPDCSEHVRHFTLASLREALEHASLKVEDIFGDAISYPIPRIDLRLKQLARFLPNMASHLIAVCRKV